MTKIYPILLIFGLWGCTPEFDSDIVISDIKNTYPNAEIEKVQSQPCDGTFGDCYYVNVRFKTDKFSIAIDTAFQYHRKGNSNNPLTINEKYGLTKKTSDKKSADINSIKISPELLRLNVWGLHKLTIIDSTERDVVLGDVDVRLIFDSDSILTKFDSGVKSEYKWHITSSDQIKIDRTDNNFSQQYEPLIRLDQVNRIKQLDSMNLILCARPKSGEMQQYHFMKY
ncbi:MAG: hypothetical protein ABJH05_05820 [Fulvivirga sp.]